MNILKCIYLTALALSTALHCSAQTERDNSKANIQLHAANVNRGEESQSAELAAVRRAVEEGNAKWVAAWARGDAASVAATFDSEGSLLAQGGRVIKGRRQLLVYVRDWMRRFGGSARLTVTTTDLWLDGRTAYETGIARYEYAVNNHPTNLERRYFTVWRRQRDRTWKIFIDVGVPQNQVAVKRRNGGREDRVIVGDKDATDILKIADRLEKNIRGSKKVVIANAGHMVNLKKPSDFNRLVLKFLQMR